MMKEKKFLRALQWAAVFFLFLIWIPALLSQQPVRKPVQKPVQQPVQKPVQQPAQQPAEQPVQQPVEQTVQQPVQKEVKKAVQPQAVDNKFAVQSFTPRELILKQGGDAAIIVFDGKNPELVKFVRVILDGKPVENVKAGLDKEWPAVKKVSIQAGQQAKRTDKYALQLLDVNQNVLFTSSPQKLILHVKKPVDAAVPAQQAAQKTVQTAVQQKTLDKVFAVQSFNPAELS